MQHCKDADALASSATASDATSCVPKGDGVDRHVVAALVIAQMLFGAWSVVSEAWISQGEGVSYEVFFAYRCLLGAVTLSLLARYLEGKGPAAPRHVSLFEILGLASLMVLSSLTFLAAVGSIGSFLPALSETLIPAYVCAICALFRVEAVRQMKVAGMVCAVMGAVLVAVREETRKITAQGTGLDGPMAAVPAAEIASRPHPLVMVAVHVSELWLRRPGDLIGCFGMLSIHIFAAGSLLMTKKQLLYRATPLNLSASMYTAALFWAMLTVICRTSVTEPGAWRLTTKNMYALCFSLGDVTCGTALIAWATKRTKATCVAASLTLQPLFSALVARVLLGAELQTDHVVGVFLTTCGLLLVLRSQSDEEPAATSGADPLRSGATLLS